MKKMISKIKSTKGFTLVEMIVVMAIIGILVALLAPNVATLIKDAQDTSNDAKVKNVMTTLAAYNTKMIKDGYSFQGMRATPPAGVSSVTWNTGASAPDGCIARVTSTGTTEINTVVKSLWKDASTNDSTVEFVGTSSGYLPANVLSGTEAMYIYLTKEGNVLGVVYVDANTYVKAANTNLSVGNGGLAVTKGGAAVAAGTVINSSLVRDLKLDAAGKVFTE